MSEGGATRPTSPTSRPVEAADLGVSSPDGLSPAQTPPPFLLDFYPLEDAKFTRLSPFFDALHAGRFTTTRCAKDGLHWPPRVVCPTC
ncbi:MAG TPA: zinc ribbon domain-containing protein, partial [Thermoplasmata archaeon]